MDINGLQFVGTNTDTKMFCPSWYTELKVYIYIKGMQVMNNKYDWWQTWPYQSRTLSRCKKCILLSPQPSTGNMQILVWKLFMHTADYQSFLPAAGPWQLTYSVFLPYSVSVDHSLLRVSVEHNLFCVSVEHNCVSALFCNCRAQLTL